MGILIVAIIVLIVIAVVFGENKKQGISIENVKGIEYSKYETNGYVMTQTELKFYRELKK